MLLPSTRANIWGKKKATTPQTKMVNNDKTKNNDTCSNLGHSSVLTGLRQNTQSPARVNIYGLYSAKNPFFAMSFHPLRVSHSIMYLPGSQSPLRPR